MRGIVILFNYLFIYLLRCIALWCGGVWLKSIKLNSLVLAELVFI